MSADFKISVLIVTKNRPQILRKCLKSIRDQILLPSQIVVIDNGDDRETKETINDFTKTSQIKVDYFQEKRQGEAFARNMALRKAVNEILVFIDDDCIANKNWLKTIVEHFQAYPDTEAIVGKSTNALPNNICANVSQAYYVRWLMESITNFNQTQRLQVDSNFFDTKNLVLRKKFIKKFSFDSDILFHSINVDFLAGQKLIKKGQIYFNPQLRVFHRNPHTLGLLLKRNFIQGIADQHLVSKKGIQLHREDYKKHYFMWLKVMWLKACQKETKRLSFSQKILFWPLLFFYPVPYKLGRLVYKIGLWNV